MESQQQDLDDDFDNVLEAQMATLILTPTQHIIELAHSLNLNKDDNKMDWDKDQASNYGQDSDTTNGQYFCPSVQTAARKVLDKMEGHFAIGDGPSRLQDLPRNCAGFPVLISSQTWNWEDMVLFYAKPLQWSLTCKMAQPVSEEQRTTKPIEQDFPLTTLPALRLTLLSL